MDRDGVRSRSGERPTGRVLLGFSGSMLIIWTSQLIVRPLRAAVPPIIPRERLNRFIKDAFWNIDELLEIHRGMLDSLHEIQREQHPYIRSLTEPVLDAALNWRDAYMEYVPHYPISWFIVQDEMGNNPAFKAFLEVRRDTYKGLHHIDSHSRRFDGTRRH